MSYLYHNLQHSKKQSRIADFILKMSELNATNLLEKLNLEANDEAQQTPEKAVAPAASADGDATSEISTTITHGSQLPNSNTKLERKYFVIPMHRALDAMDALKEDGLPSSVFEEGAEVSVLVDGVAIDIDLGSLLANLQKARMDPWFLREYPKPEEKETPSKTPDGPQYCDCCEATLKNKRTFRAHLKTPKHRLNFANEELKKASGK